MTNRKAVVMSVLGLIAFLAAAEAQEPQRRTSQRDVPKQGLGTRPEDTKAAAAAAALLESAYEGQTPPEGVRMLIAILRGSQMGPGEGWFGPAQTRYTWEWLAKRCGVDPAQRAIPRKQFPGPDAWFARLDRDKDGVITPEDLDWSDRNPYVEMSYLANRLFRAMNTSGSGRLSKEELLEFFDKTAAGKDHITADDFRDGLLKGMSAGFRPGDAPRKDVLIRGLFAGEIGSMHEGPKLNEPAPRFRLKTVDGKSSIELEKLLGSKPVVLVFGNITCGPFRSFYPAVESVYQRHKKDAHFLMIYVREAHPTDGWRMESNARAGVSLKQPTTFAERVAAGSQFCTRLKPTIPVVIDEINDPVGNAYSGMPARLYLIDRHGKVAYKSGRGPFGFKPSELEQALVMLLLDQGGPDSSSISGQSRAAIEENPSRSHGRRSHTVPTLTDTETWKKMAPYIEKESGLPLPLWIRALAVSLPKTAAAMLDLDYAQRVESTLPPQLRAKLRWIAADVHRCNYAKAYARFDYLRAGGKAEEIDRLPKQLDKLPEAERLALQLVRQLCEGAYRVSDEQMARLVEIYGEKQVVAIVLVAAYANFQDRLLSALGVEVEEGGPLPPIQVHLIRSVTAKERKVSSSTHPLVVAAQSNNLPPLPEKLDDPEWSALPFEVLRERLSKQIARPQARIRIPDWETVHANLPPDMPERDKPIRIRWSLLNYGYQPRLTAAWLGGLRAFREESHLDPIFHESMFWVVTRSLQCFY